MAPTEILRITNDDRNLDAFNPEPGESPTNIPLMVVVEAGAPPQPPAMPAPFSRLEATQERRARRTARTLSQRRATVRQAGAQVDRAAASVVGYALALCALIALRCDSFAHLVGRVMPRLSTAGLRTVRHAGAQIEHAAESVVGYGLALCALIALRCDSFAHLVGRATRGASRSTRRVGLATVRLSNAGLHTVAGIVHAQRMRRQERRALPAEESVLGHLEWEGSVVAAGLAVVAIGYGGLVSISWRHPTPTVSTVAVAAALPVTIDTTNAESAQAIVAVAPMTPDRVVDARPRVRVMNASTLNTIWRRNDTRSLQQAFTGLRRETLAFHRCSMKMTAADRAVARCDGVAGRTTFDFQRSGGRWAIRRVTNR